MPIGVPYSVLDAMISVGWISENDALDRELVANAIARKLPEVLRQMRRG